MCNFDLFHALHWLVFAIMNDTDRDFQYENVFVKFGSRFRIKCISF